MSDDNITTAESPIAEADRKGAMDAVREAIEANLDQPEATETETPTQAETVPGDNMSPPETEEADTGGDTTNDHSWRKRVDKLTWQKSELQREIDEMREKQFELQKSAPKSEPGAGGGISDLIQGADTFDDLEKLEDQASEAERWAKRSLSRYRRDPDAVEKEIENRTGQELPDDVEAWLEDLSLNAEFSREQDIPKRRKEIQRQAKSFEFASGKYPWLKDPKNPARAWVDQAKQEYPALKAMPDVDLHLARTLVGYYVEQEQSSKAKTTGMALDPTPQPGRPSSQRNQLSGQENAILNAKKRVMETGSKDGLKDFIKAAIIKT